MTFFDLLAVSLILSIVVALFGWAVMRLAGGHIADPAVRERAWAAALYAPTAPPLIVALTGLLPPEIRSISAAIDAIPAATPVPGPIDPWGAFLSVFQDAAAPAFLSLAALFAGVSLVALTLRTRRLHRLIRAAGPATPDLCGEIERQALRMRVRPPVVRVAASDGEPFLAGPFRPVLVVPASLAAQPDEAAARAICAHELAHLRRGDHRALWIEEILLAVLAVNPVLRLLRRHRADAREEACDAAALAGADASVRRIYARALVEALRRATAREGAPALTFTPRRTFVMHRLKAILSPAAPAGSRARLATVGLAALIVGVAGAGSLAIAAQREAVVIVETPAPAPAVAPAAAPTPSVAAFPVATPRPEAHALPAGASAAPRPAPPPTQDARPAAITAPVWVQPPAPSFPAEAVEAGLSEGRVTVSCAAMADGRLSACTVLNETPEGAGFGPAAVEAMRSARVSPSTIDSAASGARVTFTVRFRM